MTWPILSDTFEYMQGVKGTFSLLWKLNFVMQKYEPISILLKKGSMNIFYVYILSTPFYWHPRTTYYILRSALDQCSRVPLQKIYYIISASCAIIYVVVKKLLWQRWYTWEPTFYGRGGRGGWVYLSEGIHKLYWHLTSKGKVYEWLLPFNRFILFLKKKWPYNLSNLSEIVFCWTKRFLWNTHTIEVIKNWIFERIYWRIYYTLATSNLWIHSTVIDFKIFPCYSQINTKHTVKTKTIRIMFFWWEFFQISNLLMIFYERL